MANLSFKIFKIHSCDTIKIHSFYRQASPYSLAHSTPEKKNLFSWTNTKSPRVRLFSKICRK